MKQTSNILWIDRWSKYIWLAYVIQWQKFPLPIWYILNDQMLYFSLADLVIKYKIKKIIVWYPQRQKDIQEKINIFIKKLSEVIDENIEFEKVDEDYSSVQAGEIISNFKKNEASDTVSAMLILERYLNENNDW